MNILAISFGVAVSKVIVVSMTWTISAESYKKMADACVEGFPLESCGLFLGPITSDNKPSGEIAFVWPATNIEKSARIYSVDPKDMFESTRYANENGWEIVGVYHSHTHTQGYPSPTDVQKAVDPDWCYAIVSLEKENIETNYFQIVENEVLEIEIKLV